MILFDGVNIPILNRESIVVGSNLIRDYLPKELPTLTTKISKFVVITDNDVKKIHYSLLFDSLIRAGIAPEKISFQYENSIYIYLFRSII